MDLSLIPRLSSSTQWTELPSEFTVKLQAVFERQFGPQAQLGEFLVQGRIYPQEIIMRMGYVENGRLRQINFEASMDLPPRLEETEEDKFGEENLTMDRLYACVDALGSLMEEYFKTGNVEEMDVPLRWKDYDFEGETVFLQYSTVNSRLEDEADRILRMAGELEAGSGLVHEGLSSEDALAVAEIDSELALEVQKLIRAGKHPLQKKFDGSDQGSDLN